MTIGTDDFTLLDLSDDLWPSSPFLRGMTDIESLLASGVVEIHLPPWIDLTTLCTWLVFQPSKKRLDLGDVLIISLSSLLYVILLVLLVVRSCVDAMTFSARCSVSI
jgi:hypothetical protein